MNDNPRRLKILADKTRELEQIDADIIFSKDKTKPSSRSQEPCVGCDHCDDGWQMQSPTHNLKGYACTCPKLTEFDWVMSEHRRTSCYEANFNGRCRHNTQREI